MSDAPAQRTLPDLATTVAIALVAYALANALHEGLGHGGACVLLGGQPKVLSSLHFECGEGAMTALGRRGVAAAGTLVNLATGALSLLAYRRLDPRRRPAGAFFFWLLATINLLMAAGYFLFSGVGDVGDWAQVAHGLLPPAVWRPAMATLGGGLYYLLTRSASRWLAPLVGEGGKAAAWRLAMPAYFAGGLLFCISGLFNSVGPILIAVSAAAASFGGTSGLLWLTSMVRPGDPAPAIERQRSTGWMVAGAVVAALFVGVLGPAIHLTPG